MIWLKYVIWGIVMVTGVVGVWVMARLMRTRGEEKMPLSFWAYVAWVGLMEIIAFVLYFVVF